MNHVSILQVYPEPCGGVQQPRARQGADRPLEDDLGEAEPVHERPEREADLQHRNATPLQTNLFQPGCLRAVS